MGTRTGIDRVCKILLVLTFLLAAGFYSATAEVGEGDECRAACAEARSRCVTICGEHSNPAECDSQCDEQAEECEESCG